MIQILSYIPTYKNLFNLFNKVEKMEQFLYIGIIIRFAGISRSSSIIIFYLMKKFK